MTKINMEHDTLTVAEAAALLGVTASRVRHMILAGRLPAEKRGRDLFIKRDDLALVAHRRNGRPPKRA